MTYLAGIWSWLQRTIFSRRIDDGIRFGKYTSTLMM
jgi:hypothetical protein